MSWFVVVRLILAKVLALVPSAYAAAGALDPTFGSAGRVTTDIGGISVADEGNAIAIQADGKIIVVGTSNDDFAVARYTSTGALDNSFGTVGKVTTDFQIFADPGFATADQANQSPSRRTARSSWQSQAMY